jgi:hypothetical protein
MRPHFAFDIIPDFDIHQVLDARFFMGLASSGHFEEYPEMGSRTLHNK